MVAGWDVRRTGEGIAAHGRRRQPSNDGRSAPVRAWSGTRREEVRVPTLSAPVGAELANCSRWSARFSASLPRGRRHAGWLASCGLSGGPACLIPRRRCTPSRAERILDPIIDRPRYLSGSAPVPLKAGLSGSCLRAIEHASGQSSVPIPFGAQRDLTGKCVPVSTGFAEGRGDVHFSRPRCVHERRSRVEPDRPVTDRRRAPGRSACEISVTSFHP